MHYCQSEQCDRFMLAAQLIVSIILKMKKFNQTFEEASKFISLYVMALELIINTCSDANKSIASPILKIPEGFVDSNTI